MAESYERDLSLVNRRHLVIVNILKPPHAMPVFSGEPVTDTDDIYKRLAGHMVLSDLEELKVKLKQILDTGATFVISPCHNCWDAIRDMEEVYEKGITWSFLKPLLIDMVIVPDHLKPEDE